MNAVMLAFSRRYTYCFPEVIITFLRSSTNLLENTILLGFFAAFMSKPLGGFICDICPTSSTVYSPVDAPVSTSPSVIIFDI
ncbi:hypothetical protein NY2A_b515L [Paramecium bursaria Chlorella virus NY2A]|uniref:Uncharacterized protein b515L n=1 Tax=Paramecium bursaria Chlorella virus NY2A TaxID=46021 RepID=A7IX40_PBCVN|nr:hypothetical protein NY2A_b515L [Paramecium bursaria Chlorella virus NY2A]ABT14914.1 hypothetical protein NY2A_b515L [Paramecium bursaria Chlorella virus NY2A]